MNLDTPSFTNKDEEIKFWMNLAHEMHQRQEDVERELEEFQENSQMLERELEASLEQAERTIRELEQRNSRLSSEVEQLRMRQEQQSNDCAKFQTQIQKLKILQEQQLKYIRELEQKNDDLERAHRIVKATEEEIEAKFNLEIEKNALLESELDEKDSLKVIVQRLMDEIRDLKQEIHVQERRHPDNDKLADRVRNQVDSNKLQTKLESHNTPPSSPMNQQSFTPTVNSTTPQTKIANGVIGNNNNNNMNSSLAPCTRILAMNMIGDLMRKVGALENKLNTCRNASREDQTVHHLYRMRQKRGLPASNNNNQFRR